MRLLDWIILVGSLVFIVVYGVWKGRKNRNLDDYLLADRSLRWYTIALSIMATQASAITFISTPGQAYSDGMRFVQFYLGLPVGMVILSITAVPIYHRLKVYTAYEYLEQRFDLKTRTLAASLFLVQRGLAAGLTIFAPALILSIIMGWSLWKTNLIIGGLVVIYTAWGGTKAVSWTNFHQMLIAMGGMVAAFVAVLWYLPHGIGFMDAVRVAGKLGKLNAIDFSFSLHNQYTFWSGVIGGLFLQLSYFGTDQSQVGRYLTGSSVTESRLGLLFNGMVKVPMQFFILFVGIMVFVFYQFVTPPVFFNPVQTAHVKASVYAGEFSRIEAEHASVASARAGEIRDLVRAMHSGDDGHVDAAAAALERTEKKLGAIRSEAIEVMKKGDPNVDGDDTNYVFLTFVMHYLPTGIVGLVIAAVFAASMSSTSSELNSLASTTAVDLYKRMWRTDASENHYVRFTRWATVFWGGVAISFAMVANRLGTLVVAVNKIGSIFYGTILGIFLVAFYLKRVRGTATFAAAIVAEGLVVWCHLYSGIAWLWYNVVGCIAVIALALVIEKLAPRERAAA